MASSIGAARLSPFQHYPPFAGHIHLVPRSCLQDPSDVAHANGPTFLRWRGNFICNGTGMVRLCLGVFQLPCQARRVGCG